MSVQHAQQYVEELDEVRGDPARTEGRWERTREARYAMRVLLHATGRGRDPAKYPQVIPERDRKRIRQRVLEELAR